MLDLVEYPRRCDISIARGAAGVDERLNLVQDNARLPVAAIGCECRVDRSCRVICAAGDALIVGFDQRGRALLRCVGRRRVIVSRGDGDLSKRRKVVNRRYGEVLGGPATVGGNEEHIFRLITGAVDIGRLDGEAICSAGTDISEGSTASGRARVQRTLGKSYDFLVYVTWLEEVRRDIDRLAVLSKPRIVRQRVHPAAGVGPGLHGDSVLAPATSGIVTRADREIIKGRGGTRGSATAGIGDDDKNIAMIDPVVDSAGVRVVQGCPKEGAGALWKAGCQDSGLAVDFEAYIDSLEYADSVVVPDCERLIGWRDGEVGDGTALCVACGGEHEFGGVYCLVLVHRSARRRSLRYKA